MAHVSLPSLHITGSKTFGRADITVGYLVTFEEFDVKTNQPFHAHATIVGIDPGVEQKRWEWGLGDFQASMAPLPGFPLWRSITFSVPLAALDEDQAINGVKNDDEIAVLLTVTPLAGKVIGPLKTNPQTVLV